MNKSYRNAILRLVAGGALLLFASLAQAQYVWVDEKGIKQFSDRPPPPSVPDKNILKAPGQAPVTLVPIAAATDAAPKAAPAPDPKAPPTVAERNADYKKRAGEQAERDKKAAGEAAHKAAQAENCVNARKYQAQLASGDRIGTTEKNGERGYMDDAERARQTARTNKIVADCTK
jgi:hypothetical protein